jgi:hypothetical protein
MKGYVLTLFFVVGFVWSASAQQPDPKLVGTWETYDGPCSPCMMWLYSSGHTETRNSHSIRGVFDEPTHDEKVSCRI